MLAAPPLPYSAPFLSAACPLCVCCNALRPLADDNLNLKITCKRFQVITNNASDCGCVPLTVMQYVMISYSNSNMLYDSFLAFRSSKRYGLRSMAAYRRTSKADRAREFDNQLNALELSLEGRTLPQVAAALGVSTKTAGRYLDRERDRLARERKGRSPEEIDKMTLFQTEFVLLAMAEVRQQMDKVKSDPKASEAYKLFAMSAALRALAVANKRVSAMNGLDAPTKIVEEQRRLQVNINRSEKGTTLTWDRSILEKLVRPVPGLTMYEGCRNNGDTEKQLPDTSSD